MNAAEHAGRFYAALRAVKVPAELHVYSSGGHGSGIRKTGKTSAAWPAAQVRERVAEVIELADLDVPDLIRSRIGEQEVLDILDADPTR